MSNSVTPALAQPHGAKPKADRPGHSKDADQSTFGEALQVSRKAAGGGAEKAPFEPGQRWLAPIKLAVAIGKVERAVSQPLPEIAASVEPDEIGGPDDEPRTDDDEEETSAATVFPPVSVTALHHPAFAAPRGGKDADPDLPRPRAGIETPAAIAGPRSAAADADAAVKQAVSVDPPPLAAPDRSAAAPGIAPEASVLRSMTSGGKSPIAPAAAESDADVKPAAPRAIVVEQATPTLAPPGNTALNLAEKLATQAALAMAPAKPEISAQAAPPVQAHSLKLQLHPAELGMVTASLRFAGEQLTIELQVESTQAHQRLSADSDAIVKTLRGLGYEIDRVTILQPAVAPSTPSRVDADPSLAGQSRSDPQSLDAGGSNNGGDRLGRRDGGRGGEEAPKDGQKNSGSPETRAGGGLYI